ncbi:MAG: Lrp/AsnC family transcriptional regulator [Candidatus Binatia bacterium]
MRAVFVMIKVTPGHVYEVADKLTELESFSEAYSISGTYDLLAKLYVDNFDDLGHLVVEQIQKLPHIQETFTILTFHAFK